MLEASQPKPKPYKSNSNELLVVSQAVEIYNSQANESGWPQCQVISKDRTSKLKARIKTAGGIDGWKAAIEKAGASDFLCNRASVSFSASIDFILQAKSFTKLIEGNYDNRKGKPNGNGNQQSNPADDPTLRAISRAATAFEVPSVDWGES